MDKTSLEKELKKAFAVKNMPHSLWVILHVLKLNGSAVYRLTGILPQTLTLYKNGMSLSKKHSRLFDQLIEDTYSIIEELAENSSGSQSAYYNAVLNILEEC